MNTLTVRGVDSNALDELRKQAKSKHSSMNKFVVETLQRTAFPGESGKKQEWHDLDNFFGSWSGADYDRIMKQCSKCRKIDSELWQ